jgi:hypothetical protein
VIQIGMGLVVGFGCLLWGCFMVSASAWEDFLEEPGEEPSEFKQNARLVGYLVPAALMFFVGIVLVFASLVMMRGL